MSPNGRTLYVADDNAPANYGVVWPLDLVTGQRGGAIRVTGPAFRLAIKPDGRMLYATDGSVITPIDPATGTTKAPIQPGLAPGPNSLPILMSRDGRTLYIAGEARIRRYDLAAGRFGADIRASWPEAMLLSRDGATLWYASFGNEVVAVDLATGTVKARIKVKTEPVALAMTPNGRTLYVAIAGSGRTGHPAEAVPITVATGAAGPGIPIHDPVALAMAPDGQTLYVLATPPGTEGDGPTVRGWVTPITLATRTTRHPVRVGYDPTAIAITPNGKTLYVTNEDSGTISVIPARR
jgi:DNA-binding beta-propeller fold protein YncE